MRALFLMVALALVVATDASAAAPCREPGARGFLCATLSVPLDREGVRPGTLKLPVAYERPRTGVTGVLVALSGGPGQSSIVAARSFRDTLAPVLRRARLVVLDQRGTGVAALRCPELQRLGGIDAVPTSAVSACATRLGSARADYSTADTVADLEALRRRFAVPRLTIMGVSYGTYVAAQYARTYPDRVAGLILDSPVGPDGIDPYLLDSLGPLKRIVDGWCDDVACPVSVAQPWAALGSVAARLRAGPLTARLPDARGRLRQRTLADEGGLERLIGAADLNPALQALLPGALAAAAGGDAAPLLRLMPAAAGAPFSAAELSSGLNMATVCADTRLPFGLDDDVATRRAKMAAALDAIDPASYQPFSRETVLDGSVAADCTLWPSDAGAARPSSAPLPDVPALILSGGFDQRTPTEGAQQLRALLPSSDLVVVRGTGHDTIDSDGSGCIARALGRFADRRPVGQPCARADNRWRFAQRPARTVAPGDRGLVQAVVATLHDARLQAVARLFAGFPTASGGGLRGGRFSGSDGLTLRNYELIDGLRVTTTDARGSRFSAVLPDGRRARFRLLSSGVVQGTIGGRTVQQRAPELLDLSARPAQAAARAAGGYVPRR